MPNYLYYDYLHSQVCLVSNQSIQTKPFKSIPSYLNTLCLENGSSLQGRKESFQYLLNQRKFIPIFVSENEFYFPIENTSSSTCLWVNYQEIENVFYTKKTCTIQFKDHTCLKCNYPKRIQMIRKHIFRYLLMIRTLT